MLSMNEARSSLPKNLPLKEQERFLFFMLFFEFVLAFSCVCIWE